MFWTKSIKLRDPISNIGQVPKVIPLKLFLSHSWFRKSQEILKNPILCQEFCLTRTTHAACIHSSRRHPSNTRGTCNMIRRRPANLESKNNPRETTFGIRPVWGIQSLSLILSCLDSLLSHGNLKINLHRWTTLTSYFWFLRFRVFWNELNFTDGLVTTYVPCFQ